MVELHSQCQPVHLKSGESIAIFLRVCELCKLPTTLRVLTAFFGITRHLGLQTPFPAADAGIDSKNVFLCQYGSRAVQHDGFRSQGLCAISRSPGMESGASLALGEV
jgi:hypothetical protein